MEEKMVYVFDFYNSDLEVVESKFMSEDEAMEYAIKTKTAYKRNIAHDKI